MDRLFLDANVLFSAAYRSRTDLLRLWKLTDVVLCSSRYALAEAYRNLDEPDQRNQLSRLAQSLRLYDPPQRELPRGVSLSNKDAPILVAAIECHATFLLTGDLRHFGAYFGKKIDGVTILPPGEYLKLRSGKK